MKFLLPFFILCSGMLMACAPADDGCAYKGKKVDFLDSLVCRKDFDAIKGLPLSSKYGQVESIKIVYKMSGKRIFFVESKLYPYHHDFCMDVLGYQGGLGVFNATEYTKSKNRHYVLANINYYSASGIYAVEFFAGDQVSDEKIIELFRELKKKTFFGNDLKLLINSSDMMERSERIRDSVPLINVSDIYGAQKYQVLNRGEAYGYLKKVDVKKMKETTFSRRDLVVLNGTPNDIPVVAGILTGDFQTPLSHINLLSRNRGTPNATYKDVWNNKHIDSLEGKLVHYIVRQDTFYFLPARLDQAEKFWAKKQPSKRIVLECLDDIKGLKSIYDLTNKSVNVVGGKAANFGELNRIMVDKEKIPLPEAAFAIPFYYYRQHIDANGIQKSIDSVLASDSIKADYKLLEARLKKVQKMIKKAPLDSAFLALVTKKIRANGKYKAMRFRSSTNAEDIEGFNGAGLYDSKTGILDDTSKTIEKAIKQVWASLWNIRAFEEREYFRIDQKTVAMGLLVHRAFGDEEVNGVAITKNLYRYNYYGLTINAQKGEVSVVFPPDSVTCDQVIVNAAWINSFDKLLMEYISNSNINGGKPVMTDAEITQLSKYLISIKNHFCNGDAYNDETYNECGVDVEFKLDKDTRKIYIKQARPY